MLEPLKAAVDAMLAEGGGRNEKAPRERRLCVSDRDGPIDQRPSVRAAGRPVSQEYGRFQALDESISSLDLQPAAEKAPATTRRASR